MQRQPDVDMKEATILTHREAHATKEQEPPASPHPPPGMGCHT